MTRYEGYERYQTNTVKCPQTFQKMITTFGMPKQENVENVEKSKARLYFDNTVKVTEDFVSYDLLRFGLSNEYVYESFLKKKYFQHGGRNRWLLWTPDWVFNDGPGINL